MQKDLDGPGALLGYRAMHKKIKQQHNIKVPRDAVYTVMAHLDEEGLKARGGVGGKRNMNGKGILPRRPQLCPLF